MICVKPRNENPKAHKQIPTVRGNSRFFLFGNNFPVRCMMANSAVYWLVKTASKIMIIVNGVGAAASNGMLAVVV